MSSDPYSGKLQATPLAKVLRRIYLARASGVLDLKQNRDQRMIALVEGEIRTARCNQLEKRVGQYALQREVINRVDLLRAMSVKEPDMPIGQKLVQVGALSEGELKGLLDGLVREIIFECFAWADGDFRFRKGRPDVAEKVQIHVSTADIIHQGFKAHSDERRARQVIGDLNAALIPNPNLRLLFQHVTLDSAEAALLAKIDGTQSAAELSCTMEGDPSRNMITIGALLACGLLSTRSPGDMGTELPNFFAQRASPTRTSATVTDEPQPKVQAKDSEAKRPPRRKATVPTVPTVLTVEKESPVAPEIRHKAVQRPTRPRTTQIKQQKTPPVAKLIERDIKLMRDTVQNKYAIVNSGGYDFYTLLGLPFRTTHKEIYYSFLNLCELCHPDLAHQEPFSDLKRELEVVFEALEEAYATLMDATKRDAYDRKHKF